MKKYYLIAFAAAFIYSGARVYQSSAIHAILDDHGIITEIALEKHTREPAGDPSQVTFTYTTETGRVVRQTIESSEPVVFFIGAEVIYNSLDPDQWQFLQDYRHYSFAGTASTYIVGGPAAAVILANLMIVLVVFIRAGRDREEIPFSSKMSAHLRALRGLS